ncbi:MAG: hypothetical protein WCK86_19305 [Planctomycetia bacterium]
MALAPSVPREIQMSSTDDLWLMRIEAVNLGAFISDSSDLSTIRGAGLLVLSLHLHLTDWDADSQKFGHAGLLHYNANSDSERIPDPLDVKLRWHTIVSQGEEQTEIELELISAGASAVIYCFQASAANAHVLQENADKYLREHRQLRFATFSAALGPLGKGEDFAKSSEQILRSLRKRQLRTLTVGPGWTDKDTAHSSARMRDRFCDIDGKRAAEVSLNHSQPRGNPGSAYAKAVDKNFASRATEVRRGFGRRAKLRLYHMIGSVDPTTSDGLLLQNFKPTWELQDISARGNRRVQLEPNLNPDPLGRLSGKIAVLYIDGNKFASQIRQCSQLPATAQQVDRRILTLRRGLLRELVRHIQSDNRFYWRVRAPAPTASPGEQQFRIETLMWGGDEMIWVVPAWCGLEVVRFFFEHTQNWSLSEPNAANAPRLTHSAGLVFCSHKCPIQTVVSLAQQLAESAKQTLVAQDTGVEARPDYNRTSGNCLAYQVLESFDHIGGDFDKARARHRFPSMSARESVLSFDQLRKLIEHMNQLKHQVQLPGTRRHQIARLLRSHQLPPDLTPQSLAATPYGQLMRRIAQTVRPASMTEDLVGDVLNDTLGNSMLQSLAAKWYHIVELWDYLGSLDQVVSQRYEQPKNSIVESRP